MKSSKVKAVQKAIQKELRKDLWKEAKSLVEIAPENRLDELLGLHKADNGNIFCLALDSIKYDLLKARKITKKDFPSFGAPFC
jgi:hypothetical protein